MEPVLGAAKAKGEGEIPLGEMVMVWELNFESCGSGEKGRRSLLWNCGAQSV